MSVSLCIFGACVLFMGWRGWRLGLRQVLIQALASILALLASTLMTPLLLKLLGGVLSLWLIWLVGGMAIFILVLIIATRILKLLLEPLSPPPLLSKSSGLSLNAGLGVLIGLLLVWGVNFVSAMVTLSRGQLLQAEQTVLERMAGSEMQWLVTWSAQASQLSPLETSLLGALAFNPAAIIGDVQQLVISADLRALINDTDAQLLMRKNNLMDLRKLPLFSDLMANKAARDLAQRVAEAGYANGEEAVALQFARAWRGYDFLTQMLRDEEVQRLLQEKNLVEQIASGDQIAIMRNPALWQLLRRLTLLMQTAYHEPHDQTLTIDALPAQPGSPSIIYRWQSEDNVTHYSPLAEVPVKFQASAVPVKLP